MDPLSFIAAVFSRVDNVAVVILLVVTGLLLWLYLTERAECRADRKDMMQIITQNTEALRALERAVAAMDRSVALLLGRLK